jgi:hypothetical protein
MIRSFIAIFGEEDILMDWTIIIEESHDKKVYLCSYCGKKIVCKAHWEDSSRYYEDIDHSCRESKAEQTLSDKAKELKKQLYETDRQVGQQRKKRKYIYKFGRVFVLDPTIEIIDDGDDE